MHQRLTMASWRKTVGSWSSVTEALRQHPPEQRDLLQDQIKRLINQLTHHEVAPHGVLRNGLPAAAVALDTTKLLVGLRVATEMAARGMDPTAMLHIGLATAAKSLNEWQFYLAIDFARRLIGRRLDPSQVLQYAMPAAAQNSSAPAAFQANLEVITSFILNCGKRRYPGALKGLSALATLPPTLFRAAIEAAAGLAKKQFDPSPLITLLPVLAKTITEEQLWAALDLTMSCADLGIDCSELLRSAFVDLAKSIDQREFFASLEAVSRLAEMHVHPELMLRHGLPIAWSARATAADFQENLQALEEFVATVGLQDGDQCRRLLMWLPVTPMTAEQLRASLSFAVRLRASEVDPGIVFQSGLAQALNACEQPGDVELTFAALERFVAQVGVQNWSLLTKLLSLIPSTGFSRPQFCAGLEAACRMKANDVNPDGLLQHGLPAAAKVSTTAADFEARLRAFEAFWSQVAKHKNANSSGFAEGLQVALDARTPTEYDAGLQVYVALIDRLTEQQLPLMIAPGLAELTQQALALKRCYEDFELVLHDAITSEYESYDSYYGTSSTSTQVHHPQWVELLPSGRRLSPLPLAMLTGERIERLLEQRSWLWQSDVDVGNRERVIERVVHWRAYLPIFLDRLIRQGVLNPQSSLFSVYLIGSYPWVASPNDLDLFLVVRGEQDVAYLPWAALNKRGVWLPELKGSAQTTGAYHWELDKTARIPELPLGISVEIVGHETLLKASRGKSVLHGDVLARRFALLYGAVLLCGNDLFESVAAPIGLLKQLHEELIDNFEQADWPELEGNTAKITAKKTWRKRESEALKKFIQVRSKH